MSINSKIAQLPPDQFSWLLSIKKIFKNPFKYNSINNTELLFAIKNKARERGYEEFNLLLDINTLEKYLTN